jgi:A1 cistron-splicing factor AAR2
MYCGVRRWHARLDPPCLQAERYRQAVRSFQLDAHLAPYDLSSWNAWRGLSSHVTAAVIDRLQPVGGNINVLAEADPELLHPTTQAEAALYEQLKQGHERQQQRQQAQQGKEQASGNGDEAMQQDQQPGAGAAAGSPDQQQQQQQAQGQRQEDSKRWSSAPHAGRCYFVPLPRLVKRGGLSPEELTGEQRDLQAHVCLTGGWELPTPRSLTQFPPNAQHQELLIARHCQSQH